MMGLGQFFVATAVAILVERCLSAPGKDLLIHEQLFGPPFLNSRFRFERGENL